MLIWLCILATFRTQSSAASVRYQSKCRNTESMFNTNWLFIFFQGEKWVNNIIAESMSNNNFACFGRRDKVRWMQNYKIYVNTNCLFFQKGENRVNAEFQNSISISTDYCLSSTTRGPSSSQFQFSAVMQILSGVIYLLLLHTTSLLG